MTGHASDRAIDCARTRERRNEWKKALCKLPWRHLPYERASDGVANIDAMKNSAASLPVPKGKMAQFSAGHSSASEIVTARIAAHSIAIKTARR
jgi:hypothetical protein